MALRVLVGVLLALSAASLRKKPRDDVPMGHDCGKTNVVTVTYSHATKVGELAGEATGIIEQSKLVFEKSQTAKTKATAAKDDKQLEGDGSEFPKELKQALDNDESVADAMHTAMGDLENELEDFEDETKKGDYSGEKVDDKDIDALREKMSELTESIKLTERTTERAYAKLKEAKEIALQSSSKVEKFIKDLSEKSSNLMKLVNGATKSAKDTLKDCAKLREEVGETVTKLGDKADKAGDQKPVVNARKADLKNSADNLKATEDTMGTALSDMETTANALTDHMKPLEKATNSGSIQEIMMQADEIEPAREKIEAAEHQFTTLKSKFSQMTEQQKELEDKQKDAKKAVA